MGDHENIIEKSIDTLIIGSGFGGAVVSCRLAEAGRSVIILEKGKDYRNSEERIKEEVADHDIDTATTRYGHFQIDHGDGMKVIRGIGVGGGSLHYFGVRLRAPHTVFNNARWPEEITRERLNPYYDLAGKMLNASPLNSNPVLGIPKRSKAFLAAAGNCQRCTTSSLEYVPIAINTGSASITSPSGEKQHPCVFCGSCLVGCPESTSFEGNVNARAMLTLNYLAVAQDHGAKIFAQHSVTRIVKTATGFDVYYENIAKKAINKIEQCIHAKNVVLGAGTMGTTEILLNSKKDLPGINTQMLGQHFSGNGDFLASATETPEDLQPTSGPSITVGGYFPTKNNDIYIEDLGSVPFMEGVLGLDKNTPKQLAVNRHSIGYLAMGTDAGDGILALKGKLKKRIHLNWNPEKSLPFYNEIIASLKELSQQLGGNYKDPQGYDPKSGAGLLTAHPLGGCVILGYRDYTSQTEQLFQLH